MGVQCLMAWQCNLLSGCLQALASEALRQRAVVQERTSWRQAVTGIPLPCPVGFPPAVAVGECWPFA